METITSLPARGTAEFYKIQTAKRLLKTSPSMQSIVGGGMTQSEAVEVLNNYGIPLPENEYMAKGGGVNKNEIKYEGVTITRLFPSGYYEFYSDKQGRFVKFDDLDEAKSVIDSEGESMAKGGGVEEEIALWKSTTDGKVEKLQTFKSMRAYNSFMTKNKKQFADEHSKYGTGFYGFPEYVTEKEVERSLGNNKTTATSQNYAKGGGVDKPSVFTEEPKVTLINKTSHSFSHGSEDWYDVAVNGLKWSGTKVEYSHRRKDYYFSAYEKQQGIQEKMEWNMSKTQEDLIKEISKALVGETYIEYPNTGLGQISIPATYYESSNTYLKDGGGVESEEVDITEDLQKFDLNDLDTFETQQYNHFSKSMKKEEALQILINTVEGDFSQLSPSLAELAEKQNIDWNVEYARGGGIGSWFKNKFSRTPKEASPKEFEVSVVRKDGTTDNPIFNSLQSAESHKRDMESLGHTATITPMYAKGGSVEENLLKELGKLRRDLNSQRLSTYMEGDTSEEEMARQKEREVKLARFNEILQLLREMDTKLKDGGDVGTHTYKLGDKWRNDFDYDGMIEMGLKSELSWGVEKLRKLHTSLEDVNYATPAGFLWNAIKYFEGRSYGKATDEMGAFHDSLKDMDEDEEFAKGGGVYYIPYDTKITGIYHVVGDGIDAEIKIYGAEKQDSDSYSLYQSSSTEERNNDILSVIVKNTEIKRLSQGNTVEGIIEKTGAKVKITRTADLFAEGGGVDAVGKNTYKAFWRGKETEVSADTSYQAQLNAAKFFKAKKSYEVTVMLLTLDGKEYVHSTSSFAKGGGVGVGIEVELGAEPNPDYNDSGRHEATINIPLHRVKATTIEEARGKVMAFTDENDLGSGNYSGGKLFSDGKEIGYVSYNGRVWGMDGKPMVYSLGGGIEKDVWKKSEKYGSFYKVIDDNQLVYVPAEADGTMEMDNGEPNISEVDLRAFAEEDQQPFVDEMVSLFGKEIFLVSPIVYFGRENKFAKGGGIKSKYGVFVYGELFDEPFSDELTADASAHSLRSIHPEWKIEVKPVTEEFAKGGELKANDIPLGTWLQHKKTGVKVKVWNVDPTIGRMQLEDIYGNRDTQWRYASEWKIIPKPIKDLKEIKEVWAEQGQEFVYAKGGIVVSKLSDIPNIKKRVDNGDVTYRGLGMGKLSNDFYKIAGENGTRIKVDGKEYFITDTDYRKLAWDDTKKGWNGKIRFNAPSRKFEDGGGVEDSFDISSEKIKRVYEQAGIPVKKIRRARLDDGWFVYHKYASSIDGGVASDFIPEDTDAIGMLRMYIVESRIKMGSQIKSEDLDKIILESGIESIFSKDKMRDGGDITRNKEIAKEFGMKVFDVLNSEGKSVDSIVAKDKESASNKLKFKYPDGYAFMKLKEIKVKEAGGSITMEEVDTLKETSQYQILGYVIVNSKGEFETYTKSKLPEKIDGYIDAIIFETPELLKDADKMLYRVNNNQWFQTLIGVTDIDGMIEFLENRQSDKDDAIYEAIPSLRETDAVWLEMIKFKKQNPLAQFGKAYYWQEKMKNGGGVDNEPDNSLTDKMSELSLLIKHYSKLSEHATDDYQRERYQGRIDGIKEALIVLNEMFEERVAEVEEVSEETKEIVEEPVTPEFKIERGFNPTGALIQIRQWLIERGGEDLLADDIKKIVESNNIRIIEDKLEQLMNHFTINNITAVSQKFMDDVNEHINAQFENAGERKVGEDIIEEPVLSESPKLTYYKKGIDSLGTKAQLLAEKLNILSLAKIDLAFRELTQSDMDELKRYIDEKYKTLK